MWTDSMRNALGCFPDRRRGGPWTGQQLEQLWRKESPRKMGQVDTGPELDLCRGGDGGPKALFSATIASAALRTTQLFLVLGGL